MKCINPKTIWPHRSVEWCDENEEYSVTVGCGKCIACLSDKRKEWQFRLEQEYRYSKSAYFVTLTYDAKHLPSDRSLDKRHIQLFLKRLRKRDGSNKIRYYCVGEYGTNYGRPHYHILLFNVLEEQDIRRSWSDKFGRPVGIVHIGRVSAASVGYVTKYIIQPDNIPTGCLKPFAMMSRGYGIGGRYLSDAMVKWHRDNKALYCMRNNEKVRMPRFYQSKVWYKSKDREPVARAALIESLKRDQLDEEYYSKKFGSDWKRVVHEFRLRELCRIKVKVAFTQKL